MNRLFFGLNVWGAIFLVAAVASGWGGSAWHLRLGIFSAVFVCLVQSGIIALFLGAAKLIKEHVGRFGMPATIIEHLNDVYHRLFPMAAAGAVAIAAAAIVGGLGHIGRVPGWVHAGLALSGTIYLIAVIPFEYRLQTRLHAVLLEVERHLPRATSAGATDGVVETPSGRPIRDPRARAKALLYVGLTVPLPYLGYTFISGRDMSLLLLPTVLLTACCLLAALYQHRVARRADRVM